MQKLMQYLAFISLFLLSRLLANLKMRVLFDYKGILMFYPTEVLMSLWYFCELQFGK